MSHMSATRTIMGVGVAVALGAALSGCSLLGIGDGSSEEEGESVFTLAVGDCTDTSDSSEELSTTSEDPLR